MITEGELSPLGPLQFRPVLKDYVWGGRALADLVGRELPAGAVAESWEISDHPSGATPVAGGSRHGESLSGLMTAHGESLVGSRNLPALARKRFPLLIKLLDANQWLSVQVHPDDAFARDHEGDLGKTEMWVVLHARPGAEIILGFERPVGEPAVREALARGTLEQLLHRVPARRGDTFFVPAGTVHAIGPGLVLAEIQQSSDVTYRLHDWNRADASGAGRLLHVERALEVTDFGAVRPGPVEPERLEAGGLERELLASCPYFRTERLRLEEGSFAGRCDGSTFEIWALLSGSASLASGRGGLELEPISWTLLPADLGPFEVRGSNGAELLRILTPPSRRP